MYLGHLKQFFMSESTLVEGEKWTLTGMPLIQSETKANRVYSVSDICCYQLRCAYVFDGFMNFPENIVCPVGLDGNHHKFHPLLDPD